MAECLCGSQKKAGAVDFINPADIGAICLLFGAQGSLCRLLDLVPDVIAKVLTLNPDFSNSTDVFGSILKKVAKKSFNLIIDEITGRIPVSQFCGNDPPPAPDDITYYDVYEFIGKVVPILNYFFVVNDVLIGNETKLLDKVVATWLRQKWFENCECKECPDPPPTPTTTPSQPFARCLPGTRPDDDDIRNSFGLIVKARPGDVIPGSNPPQLYPVGAIRGDFLVVSRNGSFPYRIDPNTGGVFRSSNFGVYYGGFGEIVVVQNPDDYYYNTFNGERITDPNAPLPYRLPVCIPIPPPPPPPEFCDLYPLDLLCRGITRTDGCTDPSANNYNALANFDDGSCTYTISGCTDPSANNYNPLANFDDGSCVYSCPPNNCKIDCPDDPRGFCCIETAFLVHLHNLVLQ